MSKVVEFLLNETSDEVNKTMLDEIMLNMYGSNYEEDDNDFANLLNDYTNNQPVTIDYLIKALDKCVLSVPIGFGLENVFNFITLYRLFDSAVSTGNFLKYIFGKYQTIEQIKDADIEEIGVYYKSKFSLLQAYLKGEVSLH